jgi:hypothetical protein
MPATKPLLKIEPAERICNGCVEPKISSQEIEAKIVKASEY